MRADSDSDLDQFLTRATESALMSLDATVDIDQKLRDLYRAAGLTHDPPEEPVDVDQLGGEGPLPAAHQRQAVPLQHGP